MVIEFIWVEGWGKVMHVAEERCTFMAKPYCSCPWWEEPGPISAHTGQAALLLVLHKQAAFPHRCSAGKEGTDL